MLQKNLNVKPLQLLNLAQHLNNFYLTGLQNEKICPFLVAGQHVGFIRLNVLKEVMKYPNVFCISDCTYTNKTIVELSPTFQDYAERTEKLEQVINDWRQNDTFPTLKGWRGEYFEVKSDFKSLLKMERAATPLFGVRRYGVHINGYVPHSKCGLFIWLQQRSNTKETWPGKWDNLVGGGLSAGHGVRETALQEAAEEASIPCEMHKNLISAGSVSMFFENELGLYPNTEYVFDLELPVEFQPQNIDGEVQSFELLSANECIKRVISPEFKITSSPVIIDFLIRHGYLASHFVERSFMQIIELLHVPLQSVYTYRKAVEN